MDAELWRISDLFSINSNVYLQLKQFADALSIDPVTRQLWAVTEKLQGAESAVAIKPLDQIPKVLWAVPDSATTPPITKFFHLFL